MLAAPPSPQRCRARHARPSWCVCAVRLLLGWSWSCHARCWRAGAGPAAQCRETWCGGARWRCAVAVRVRASTGRCGQVRRVARAPAWGGHSCAVQTKHTTAVGVSLTPAVQPRRGWTAPRASPDCSHSRMTSTHAYHPATLPTALPWLVCAAQRGGVEGRTLSFGTASAVLVAGPQQHSAVHSAPTTCRAGTPAHGTAPSAAAGSGGSKRSRPTGADTAPWLIIKSGTNRITPLLQGPGGRRLMAFRPVSTCATHPSRHFPTRKGLVGVRCAWRGIAHTTPTQPRGA